MKPSICLFVLALATVASTAVQAQYGASAYPSAPPPTFTGNPYAAPTPPPSYPYTPPPAEGVGMNYAPPPQAPAPNYNYPSNAQVGYNNNAGLGASMLSYNYIEGGYRYFDPKGNALDGNHGLGLNLGIALMQPIFLKGGFNWGSGSGNANTVAGAVNADYEFSSINIGGGVYMAIMNKLHFVGELGAVYANLDADKLGLSYTDGGVFVRPSLRYQALETLELQAGVTVSSASDYNSRVIDIGAFLRVMPQVDLNLGADFGDESRTVKAGVRMRW